MQHIALAAASGKIVSNVSIILLCCSLNIESHHSFCKKMCTAPTPKPLRSRLRRGCSLLEPSPWLPPRITEPGSATGDCDHVFSNYSPKNVFWWHFANCHSRFQRWYIDFVCKNLVSRFVPREIMVILSKIQTRCHYLLITQESSNLTELIRFHTTARHLRVSGFNCLQQDQVKLAFTERAFCHAAHVVWNNSLPKSIASVLTFRVSLFSNVQQPCYDFDYDYEQWFQVHFMCFSETTIFKQVYALIHQLLKLILYSLQLRNYLLTCFLCLVRHSLIASRRPSGNTEIDSVRPATTGEEELQLQLALALSKEEHEEEMKRQKADDLKLQMAIEESKKTAFSGGSNSSRMQV